MDAYLTVYTRGPKGVDFAEKRLWSLWDMLEIKASEFVNITTLLTRIEEICERNVTVDLDSTATAELIKNLDYLMDDYASLGLDVSRRCADELCSFLEHRINSKEIGSHIGSLRDTIRRELDCKFTFILSASEADHYNNFRKGWESIYERFPDAITDIEESRKCFALARYAASVFHTTQIIEFGLLELGPLIDVKDPKSGWTAVSNELKKIVDKRRELRTDFEKKNYIFLEQLQATVEALKNAWRNKINHAQGRLALASSEFTPEIAEEILLASRAFMRRLAEGLPNRIEKSQE